MGWATNTAYNLQVRQRTRIAHALWVLPLLVAISVSPTPSQAGSTSAEDSKTSKGQGYLIVGIGGGPKALSSYQGLIYAPMAGLSQTGPIIRLWNKADRFSYGTTLPGPTTATINAIGFSVEAQVGWQFANEIGRIAVYGGIVWKDHILTPSDPGSNLTKSRIGFSATLDGEYKFSQTLGVMANGSFIQGFNQYWGQAKPYYKTPDNWKIGADFALFGGKGYRSTRIGMFASDYKLNLWSNKQIYLGADAGVQFSLKGKNFTPYLGINSGFLF